MLHVLFEPHQPCFCYLFLLPALHYFQRTFSVTEKEIEEFKIEFLYFSLDFPIFSPLAVTQAWNQFLILGQDDIGMQDVPFGG